MIFWILKKRKNVKKTLAYVCSFKKYLIIPPPECISLPTVNVTLQMRRSWNIARSVDVGRHVWI